MCPLIIKRSETWGPSVPPPRSTPPIILLIWIVVWHYHHGLSSMYGVSAFRYLDNKHINILIIILHAFIIANIILLYGVISARYTLFRGLVLLEGRCNRTEGPLVRMSRLHTCTLPIRITRTPYRFILWPLWPMLLTLEAGQSNQGTFEPITPDHLARGHLSLLHRSV